MILKLALRNVWRNKRRTFITIGAVAFAVFLSSFMRSFQKGAWDNVIDNSVNLFFGYAQIHSEGYWDDQTIDNSMIYSEELKNVSSNIEKVKGQAPRMESFALASAGDLTQGVMVIGIDPEKEHHLTGIKDKIIAGNYLDKQGTIIASGIAKKLKLSVGDTLILISQGYHGANAAGKFAIEGIFKYALPDLNKRLVYLPLAAAQDFYAAEGRITTLALKIDNSSDVPDAISGLKQNLDLIKYEVLDYKELIPELVQARQVDEAGGLITLGILYTLIAFTIFGTILMMTKERSYEFGVLTAIGMERWKLFLVIFTETTIVALMGALVGILMAVPLVYYLHLNPVDLSAMGEEVTAVYEKFGMEPVIPSAFSPLIFLRQAWVIFLVTCVLGLYPLFKILKLQPVKAMRS